MWGSTYQCNFKSPYYSAKDDNQLISKAYLDSHTDVLFSVQEILKLSDIYLYQIGRFMYLFKRSTLFS